MGVSDMHSQLPPDGDPTPPSEHEAAIQSLENTLRAKRAEAASNLTHADKLQETADELRAHTAGLHAECEQIHSSLVLLRWAPKARTAEWIKQNPGWDGNG